MLFMFSTLEEFACIWQSKRVGIIVIVIERTLVPLSHFCRCCQRLLCGTVETMQWFAIVSILEIPLPGPATRCRFFPQSWYPCEQHLKLRSEFQSIIYFWFEESFLFFKGSLLAMSGHEVQSSSKSQETSKAKQSSKGNCHSSKWFVECFYLLETWVCCIFIIY